jgi:hypothetical protein
MRLRLSHKRGPLHLSPTNEAQTPSPLSVLTFASPSDFKSTFADVHQIRLGTGTTNITFSKTTHVLGSAMLGNVVEEQCEIVISREQMKMLFMNLSATVSAIEDEIGPIPVPRSFQINQDAHRAVIRSLNLPSRKAEPSSTP